MRVRCDARVLSWLAARQTCRVLRAARIRFERAWIPMKRSFAPLTASLTAVVALGQTAPPTSPPQDPQVALREMLCGNQGLPPTSTEIPTIGCFGVPSGGRAAGRFNGDWSPVAVGAR